MENNLSIAKRKADGTLLVLSDGSRWSVRIGDNTLSACWYPTQHVTIDKSDDPGYPYRIKNLNTSSQEEVAACQA
jgi:hypothetical protein